MAGYSESGEPSSPRRTESRPLTTSPSTELSTVLGPQGQHVRACCTNGGSETGVLCKEDSQDPKWQCHPSKI